MYRWSNICAMPSTLVVICIVLLWSITSENPFTRPRCTFLLYPRHNPCILSCISEALSKAIKSIHPTCGHQVNPSNLWKFDFWINALTSENYSLRIRILSFFSVQHFFCFFRIPSCFQFTPMSSSYSPPHGIYLELHLCKLGHSISPIASY